MAGVLMHEQAVGGRRGWWVRVALVVLVAAVGCLGMETRQELDTRPDPSSGPYKPYAVVVYGYHKNTKGRVDAAFPLSALRQWVNLLHDELGVDWGNIVVLTPRDSILADGQDVQTLLPIPPHNYLPEGGVCDVLQIVQGQKVSNVKALEQEATHVYLVVAMHGFNSEYIDAKEQEDDHIKTFTSRGGTLFPHRTAASTQCPSDAKLTQRKDKPSGWLLGGQQYRWMAEKQPPHRKLVVFVDSCMAGSFFTNVVQRLDAHSGKSATADLAKDKLALYDSQLRLPRTLIITSAADNCVSEGDVFINGMSDALSASGVAHETWGWLVDEMKRQSRNEESNRVQQIPKFSKRLAHWSLRKYAETRPVKKATMRAFQLRAFGDPSMLSEMTLPAQQSSHGGTLPDFAGQLQNGHVATVSVVRDKGAPAPK